MLYSNISAAFVNLSAVPYNILAQKVPNIPRHLIARG